jgi:hypothetical protein
MGQQLLFSMEQCSLWDNSLYGHILLNLGYWVVWAYNFNLVNKMLIVNESSIGAFLHPTLLQLYPCYYGLHIILFPTAEYQP